MAGSDRDGSDPKRRAKQDAGKRLAAAHEAIDQICGTHESAGKSGSLTVEFRFAKDGTLQRVELTERNTI
jgi:hypothetical protein